MSDHVHMLVSIPPKLAAFSVVGYLKGKSTIHAARHFLKRESEGSRHVFPQPVTPLSHATLWLRALSRRACVAGHSAGGRAAWPRLLPPDPKVSSAPELPVKNREKTEEYSGVGVAPA